MESLENKIALLISEQKQIEDLSYEVEKVLHYYQEHPQYPMDYDKVRKRMKEVTDRLNLLGEKMQKLHTSGKA
jgi:iron uptake system EfeUOB component EfeO/EfeM